MAFKRKVTATDLLEFPEQVKWAKVRWAMRRAAFRGPLDKVPYSRLSEEPRCR